MKKLRLFFAALAALWLPAAARAAPSAHVDTDAKCLAVSLVMGNAQNPDTKAMGNRAVLYFLGRIDGGPGRNALEARLAAQASTFTPESLQQDAQACMRLLASRGAAFSAITADLQQRMRRSSPPPPSSAPATH